MKDITKEIELAAAEAVKAILPGGTSGDGFPGYPDQERA